MLVKESEIRALKEQMVQSKQEESERNDKVIQELKEQVEELRSSYEALIKNNTTVSNFTKEGELVEIFDGCGNRISSRPLTKEERLQYANVQR